MTQKPRLDLTKLASLLCGKPMELSPVNPLTVRVKDFYPFREPGAMHDTLILYGLPREGFGYVQLRNGDWDWANKGVIPRNLLEQAVIST